MNERIQELYVQAIQYADSVVPPMRRYNDIYYAIVSGKHAELIVRECMSMCNETQAVYSRHRLASLGFTDKNRYAAGEQAADTIYSKIKQHFGVE